MNFVDSMSDSAALKELGSRVVQYRLNKNLSQLEFAEAAGVSRSTITRLERGESTQAANLIRVLRALGLLANLDALVPEPKTSPVQMLQRQGKSRKRASRRAKKGRETEPWSWEDSE